MKKINTSLEWARVKQNLVDRSRKLRNFDDIYKMISNVDTEVTKLSKMEVECRRMGNSGRLIPMLANINDTLDMIDGYILVASLIG